MRNVLFPSNLIERSENKAYHKQALINLNVINKHIIVKTNAKFRRLERHFKVKSANFKFFNSKMHHF